MKKLLRTLVILLVLAGLGYGWFRQSVHYALLELGRAAREGDVATVEKHLDLAAFVESGAKFAAALARVEGEKLGGEVLGELIGGLASILSSKLGDAVKPDAVAELRREIARGEAFERIGPFEPYEGFKAIGAVDTEGRKSRVILVGTCYEQVGSLVVIFERVVGPFGVPWLGTWKATGVDEGSLLILAEICRQGARNQRAR